MASSASKLSANLTKFNERFAIGKGKWWEKGPMNEIGGGMPGYSRRHTRIRQEADQALDVEPIEGDPNYVPEPAPPLVPPPLPMPDPGDPAVRATARRRSIQAQAARRGRASTVLSQGPSEPLGG